MASFSGSATENPSVARCVEAHRVFPSGRGTTRAEDAQGTPTQSHVSPSKLVYEDKGLVSLGHNVGPVNANTVHLGQDAHQRFQSSRSEPDTLQTSILYANTYDLFTWFQSKLLHVYLNITNKDRSV